nr:non-structural protein [Human bocavirus]
MSSGNTKDKHRAYKRKGSPGRDERKRPWQPRHRSRSRSPIRRSGETSSGSYRQEHQINHLSSCTASKISDPVTKTKENTSGKRDSRTNPYTVFSQHKASHPDAPGWCGFYWHSTRIARNGTNAIFNEMKQQFQQLQLDNKIGWDNARELLFSQKKSLDQQYRNMFWHFRNASDCERCNYWDNVYRMHLAHVSSQTESEEITDEEMLSAAESMETDASN